jgi:hypothetical protein
MFSWLRTRQKVPVQERQESVLRFVAEQDGDVERELKAKWIAILSRHKGVTRAFLARASSGERAEPSVMLCICPRSAQDHALVQELAGPVRQTLSTDHHLDIVFLNSRDEAEVSRVAQPFFPQPNTSLERTREG